MSVGALEVGLVAGIGLALLVPLLRGAGGHSAARRDEARRRRAGWVGGALLAVAVVNFLAYSAHTGSLGGSAYTGERVAGWRSVSAGGQEYTEGNGPAPDRAGGRYYVSAHGRYTEVTEQRWRAVRAHEVAVYVTHALGLLAGGVLLAYSRRGWGTHRRAEPGAAPDPART